MKRTREELIEDIEHYTSWAESCAKRAERYAKRAKEAQKELDELNRGDEG